MSSTPIVSTRTVFLPSLFHLRAALLGLFLLVALGCGEPQSSGDGGADAGPSDASTSDGGAADAGSDGGSTPWTFSQVQAQILSGCTNARCHGVGNRSGLVELNAAAAYINLVSVPSQELPSLNFVEPGDSASSYLVNKLEGSQGAACSAAGLSVRNCGSMMPEGQRALSAATLQGLRSWIDAGAPNN